MKPYTRTFMTYIGMKVNEFRKTIPQTLKQTKVGKKRLIAHASMKWILRNDTKMVSESSEILRVSQNHPKCFTYLG